MNNAGRRLPWTVLLVLLSSCSRAPSTAITAPTSGISRPGPQYDAEKVVNVYSWADYIAPGTVANFERETGIKVHYDTFDNNEVLETKLLTGHTAYDVVVPTGNYFEHQRLAGVYRPLDKSVMPNLVNGDPQVMQWMARYDPGNRYAVPYMWSVTGVGYNVEKVRQRLGPHVPASWSLIFDPANAAKLQDCGITIIDSAADVFLPAMIYLGRDPNKHDPADLAAAAELLRRIRPFVRYIDPAQHTSDLANGSVCVSLAWTTDVGQAQMRAREAQTGVTLKFLVPIEGALVTVDTMGIPADAPHPLNAQLWLDYLMRPEVAAANSNALRAPNGNRASVPLLAPDVANDPAVYPDAATRARLTLTTSAPPEFTRQLMREWTRFRTGN